VFLRIIFLMDKVLLELKPDDKVVFDWIIGKGLIVVGSFLFVMLIFSGVAIKFIAPNLLLVVNGALILVLFGGLLLMLYFDYLKRTYEYAVTSAGIHFRGGIFWKFDKFVAFKKVTNISSERGVVEQVLKLSHINIHTAGQLTSSRGFALPEIVIEGLPEDKAVKVLELLRKKIS